MKSHLRRILSVILLMVFALATTQSVRALVAEGRTARLYDYSNEVTVIREKVELKTFKGMRLIKGDTIKTGKNSNAYIEIDSDKVVKMDSSTIIIISDMSGTTEKGSISISLSSGKIFNDIKKKLTKNSTYKVITPNAVMGVRGTTFVVDTTSIEDKTSETLLTVFGGTVAFAPTDDENLNVFVGMNQTTNTVEVAKGEKPIVNELELENLSTFELTEIIKDSELQQNLNKVLIKENKTLDEVIKKAEEKEISKGLEQKENDINSAAANENAGTAPSVNGSANANENAGAAPSINEGANDRNTHGNRNSGSDSHSHHRDWHKRN